MDPGSAFFGVAAPPAPFHIAFLQILFQMGLVVLALLAVNYLIENFTNQGTSWKTEGKKKKVAEVTDLPLLTKDLIDYNKHYIVVVAMNEMALSKCLPLTKNYDSDKLVFSKFVPSEESAGKKPIEVTAKYDMLALKYGGKEWTGIIIDDLVVEKENNLRLKDDPLDAWLLRLCLSVNTWTASTDKECPIAFKNSYNS